MEKSEITAKHLAANKTILDFQWSKDDDFIFYVTNLGKYYRVWAVPARGGYPRLMAILDEGDVKTIKVSPDGKTMAILVDYDGKENYKIFLLSTGGGIPRYITENIKLSLPFLDWSPDSSRIGLIAEKDGKYNIAALDIETKALLWLTDTDNLKMDLNWAKDGKQIAYTSFQDKLKADICIVNLDTSEVSNMTVGIGGENTGPHFSPDSKTLAFTSDSKGTKNVVLMEVETRKTMWMPEKKCERHFARWNHKGDRFVYIENEDAELTAFEWDYPPKSARRITPEGYLCACLRYSNNDDKIAVLLSTPNRPTEIYIKEKKAFRKITDSTIFGLQPDNFVKPEKVKYKSFDELEIPALYYKPENIEKYPVLIWIHGGPTSQHFNGWNPFIQLFLLNNIAVLAPNVRGSTGYGTEFENKVFHDWGGGDLQDIAYAVEFLKEDHNADMEKVIVAGGSYGGYMTMMAVTKKPDLWAAGINSMGPVNLETSYNNSTSWLKPILNQKYGFKPPEEDPDYYQDRSPINFVENINCPLLILYGKNDPRVSVNEMEQLREKLSMEGKVFEEELFETEGHSMARLETRIALFERMMKFIDRYVFGKEILEEEMPFVPDVPDMPEDMESPLTFEIPEDLIKLEGRDTSELPDDEVELNESGEMELPEDRAERGEEDYPDYSGDFEIPEIDIPELPVS